MDQYTLVITNDGLYAMSMRYNHKLVEFTDDINKALWACDASQTDIIELRKICDKLIASGIAFDFRRYSDNELP